MPRMFSPENLILRLIWCTSQSARIMRRIISMRTIMDLKRIKSQELGLNVCFNGPKVGNNIKRKLMYNIIVGHERNVKCFYSSGCLTKSRDWGSRNNAIVAALTVDRGRCWNSLSLKISDSPEGFFIETKSNRPWSATWSEFCTFEGIADCERCYDLQVQPHWKTSEFRGYILKL
jgi:hypothetical protein